MIPFDNLLTVFGEQYECLFRTCIFVATNLPKPILSRYSIKVCLRMKPQPVWRPNYMSVLQNVAFPCAITTFFNGSDAKWLTERQIWIQMKLCRRHISVVYCIVTIKLTSFKDYAVVGYFVPSLQARAVPAVPSELVLALVDGNLDSLDCWSRHVWVTHAHLQLAPRQTRQSQTHRVGIQDRVDVGELQAQDFIGVYPAWSTHVRLLTIQTWKVSVLITFVAHKSLHRTGKVSVNAPRVSHRRSVPTVPNRRPDLLVPSVVDSCKTSIIHILEGW